MITQEAQRLSQLIDNLLDLSRLEAGAAEPQREWCDLREVIQAAVDELQLPDDTFRLQLAPDLPLIKADASQLQRAFVNLLGNSARHSGGHPVQVRAMRAPQPDHGAGRGPRARHSTRAAGARVRALLSRRHRSHGAPWLRAGTRDRARLRGGERRARVGRVASPPGNDLRARATARSAGGCRPPADAPARAGSRT